MYSVESRINELVEKTGYGKLWNKPEIFCDEWRFKDMSFRRIGLSTEVPGFGGVVGSASDTTDSDVVDRAFFELLERVATLHAMKSDRQSFPLINSEAELVGLIQRADVFPDANQAKFRYAISNGVAAHWTAKQAIPSAKHELIERDRILRSWFGQEHPETFDYSIPSLADDFEIQGARFGEGVTGIFGIPRSPARPTIIGFGNSVESARREFLQRFTFLWEEAVPETEPDFAPNSNYHQEFYLNSKAAVPALQSWFSGDRLKLSHWIRIDLPAKQAEVMFVDLTPPELQSAVRVVKAISDSRIPLGFGKGHPSLKSMGSDKIEQLIGIHPIA